MKTSIYIIVTMIMTVLPAYAASGPSVLTTSNPSVLTTYDSSVPLTSDPSMSPVSQPSGKLITLAACIDSAMGNRANILAAKTEEDIAALQTSGTFAGYLPQVSLNYNFRYNALTPAQIIPVGQFEAVPTDESRAIRFGTDWQQNAGINLYQPVFDLSIRSRISESRINERIRNADAEIAAQELISEVIFSYLSVLLKQEQLNMSVLDTVRTSRSLALVRAGYDEGRILKSDLNRALLNLNNALSSNHEARSALTEEMMYLGFLTGISVDVMLEARYDQSVWNANGNMDDFLQPDYDSIPEIRRLKSTADLVKQQQRTERRGSLPVIGIEGFLGANQYTDAFDPFAGDQWYGSGYVGINLRLPLISGENTRNRISQLKLQESVLQYRISEHRNLANNAVLRLSEEIRKIEDQLELSAQNIGLARENVRLYQERLSRGQATAYDLVMQEIELQKERASYNQLRTGLLKSRIELLRSSGKLLRFANMDILR